MQGQVCLDECFFIRRPIRNDCQDTICKGIKAEEVLAKMRAIIEAEPLAKIDYVSMVDALDMQPVESVEKDVLVAMAVYIGKTRLIDNFSYEV